MPDREGKPLEVQLPVCTDPECDTVGKQPKTPKRSSGYFCNGGEGPRMHPRKPMKWHRFREVVDGDRD